ncbi:hypothetical protein [Gaiella sp.]|uniref:hypothetical protein n=1 Tax=Gaiella sp. TaxID=2663207 RepID=UPI0039839A1D
MKRVGLASTRARTNGAAITRALGAAGLSALLAGTAAVVLSSVRSDDALRQTVPVETTPARTVAEPAPAAPASVRVSARGVRAYDPDGDQSENDGTAPLATDGVLSTAWKSERYRRSFAKTGVGLLVDAGRPVRATRIVVATETPGYTAEVRVGSSPDGPFVSVSTERSLRARTTFALEPRSSRYLMLWITSMPEGGAAAVNEITVSAAR